MFFAPSRGRGAGDASSRPAPWRPSRAAAEKISDRFVGRMMRLAYLSPDVLERLVTNREPAALSLNDLVTVADLPWSEQVKVVFD
jgi:hypothetical protein